MMTALNQNSIDGPTLTRSTLAYWCRSRRWFLHLSPPLQCSGWHSTNDARFRQPSEPQQVPSSSTLHPHSWTSSHSNFFFFLCTYTFSVNNSKFSIVITGAEDMVTALAPPPKAPQATTTSTKTRAAAAPFSGKTVTFFDVGL